MLTSKSESLGDNILKKDIGIGGWVFDICFTPCTIYFSSALGSSPLLRGGVFSLYVTVEVVDAERLTKVLPEEVL